MKDFEKDERKDFEKDELSLLVSKIKMDGEDIKSLWQAVAQAKNTPNENWNIANKEVAEKNITTLKEIGES